MGPIPTLEDEELSRKRNRDEQDRRAPRREDHNHIGRQDERPWDREARPSSRHNDQITEEGQHRDSMPKRRRELAAVQVPRPRPATTNGGPALLDQALTGAAPSEGVFNAPKSIEEIRKVRQYVKLDEDET